MSYEKDVKITFYNMEYGEEVSDEYSEFLMINRDGEVFELVHNGRGDYNPSYEGDWVGYKMESRAKADEYEAKAKAWDQIENLVKIELTSDDLYNDARNNDYAAGMLRVYEMVDYIIDDYESGEMNVEK